MDKQEREQFVADLIRLNTVGGHEDRVAHFLKAAFDARGIYNQVLPVENGRSNFYAEIGTGEIDKVVALEGHEDVVALGNPAAWDHEPLGAEIKDGKMYGRGTTDMKGGLAAECIAMFELADRAEPVRGKVKLLVTVAEESSPQNHMQGAQAFTKAGYLADVDAMILAEPSFGQLNCANKGSLTYAVTSKGKAAHSSMPQLGFNAIEPLMTFYQAQQAFFATLGAENPHLGKTVPVVTKIEGGQQLNSVPSTAALYMKVRTIPEEPNLMILDHLQELIDRINRQEGSQLALELLGQKVPVVTDPHGEFNQILHQVAEEVFDQSIKVCGSAAGTDASEMIKGNPDMTIAVFGPGNRTAHQVDEYMLLSTFHKDIEVYKQAILTYFG